ncbi:hypothetical protein BJH93_06400 [Kocuria polaris]|nr:hypothetical protein [Kocuria polaris]
MRTARRRPARAVAATAVVLLLAACGGYPEPDNGAVPAPVLPGAYDTTDRQSKGFPAAVSPPDEGQQLLLDVVRAGDHPGYDRIVFAHSGDGLPGWRTEYVDQPVAPGSGHDIAMAGDAHLAIYVTGLQPGMAGAEHGHAVIDTEWTGQKINIAQTVTTAVFEGAASYFVSLDTQRAYSVIMYDDGRLVIDFKE